MPSALNVHFEKDRLLTGRKRFRPAREATGLLKSRAVFVVQVEEIYKQQVRWRDASLADFEHSEAFLGPTL